MSHPAATSTRSEREYGVEPPACRALPLTRPACVLGPAGPEPSWPGARAVPLSMLQAICPCEYRMRRHAPARRRRTSRAVCLLSWPGNPLPACQILCQCHVPRLHTYAHTGTYDEHSRNASSVRGRAHSGKCARPFYARLGTASSSSSDARRAWGPARDTRAHSSRIRARWVRESVTGYRRTVSTTPS